MKKLIAVLGLLWGGAAAGWWYLQDPGTSRRVFQTARVRRGDLQATINASGTIEPEDVVDVGAQVAGTIQEFGFDPRDDGKPPEQRRRISYGSPVEGPDPRTPGPTGTILARLDDKLFVARVKQAEANLAKASAELMQAQAKLRQGQLDLERTRQLRAKGNGMVTSQEYDTAQANYEVARATVAMAEGDVSVAQANLEEARVNLGYTTIRSPVKGVILDRRVNVGQTVIASLNAPSLFLIARDLDHLQIWASVNETDLGGVREGQPVRFTVSSFPGRTFLGTVAQIRLNASMVQNVVTYTVVIDVENQDRELKPYQTARVVFEREHREDVLVVPNAALRWRPRPDCIAPGARDEWKQMSTRIGSESASEGVLWVRQGDFVRPLPVRVGLSDGLSSEVSGEAVRPGLEVVTGVLARETGEEVYSILPHTRTESSKPEASKAR